MISLSENKEDIAVSLASEHEFLANYAKFQEKINNNIYMLLRQLINEKIVCSLEQSQELSKNLSNLLECLDLSNECRQTIRWYAWCFRISNSRK